MASEEIAPLLGRAMGSGIASDHITVEGRPVGYMYREQPDDKIDSGWRFLSGDETQEYIDQADNLAKYDLNTIANYGQAIIPFLEFAVGTELERIAGTNQFRLVT